MVLLLSHCCDPAASTGLVVLTFDTFIEFIVLKSVHLIDDHGYMMFEIFD